MLIFKDAQMKPALLALKDGKKVQLKIDAFGKEGDLFFVGGWISDHSDMKILINGNEHPILEINTVNRADVNEYLEVDPAEDLGFSLCFKAKENDEITLNVHNTDVDANISLDKTMLSSCLHPANKAVLGAEIYDFIINRCAQDSSWKMAIESGSSPYKCGIDRVIRWPAQENGCPIVIAGWVSLPDDMDLYVGDPEGQHILHPELHYFMRPDVESSNDIFITSHGKGFICVVNGYELSNRILAFYVAKNGLMAKIKEAQISDIYGYRSFIEAVFGIDIPSTELARVYAAALVPLFSPIQRTRQSAILNLKHEQSEVGKIPDNPIASIIIPLYASLDFLESQFARFSCDSAVYMESEIIYVIDDPALIDTFIIRINDLYNQYNVPIKWIYWHGSQGFGGACNLGASIAKGEIIIFMNSDVYPVHTGWLLEFKKCLDNNKDVGLIGCRLDYPDGKPQHCGCYLKFDNSLKIWKNHHFLSESFSINNTDFVQIDFVTGACIALRRSDFIKLDGFKSNYLIGNWEDIDLCMRVKENRMHIIYALHIRMVHAWHNSFSMLKNGKWLNRCEIYNAVVFCEDWSTSLTQHI